MISWEDKGRISDITKKKPSLEGKRYSYLQSKGRKNLSRTCCDGGKVEGEKYSESVSSPLF